jgi:hypothetical protein
VPRGANAAARRDGFCEPVMFALFERLLQPTAIPRDPEPPPGLVAFYWHFARQAKGLFAGLFAAGFALALLDGLQEEIGLKPVWVGEFRCQPLRDRDAVVEAVDSADSWVHIRTRSSRSAFRIRLGFTEVPLTFARCKSARPLVPTGRRHIARS